MKMGPLCGQAHRCRCHTLDAAFSAMIISAARERDFMPGRVAAKSAPPRRQFHHTTYGASGDWRALARHVIYAPRHTSHAPRFTLHAKLLDVMLLQNVPKHFLAPPSRWLACLMHCCHYFICCGRARPPASPRLPQHHDALEQRRRVMPR